MKQTIDPLHHIGFTIFGKIHQVIIGLLCIAIITVSRLLLYLFVHQLLTIVGTRILLFILETFLVFLTYLMVLRLFLISHGFPFFTKEFHRFMKSQVGHFARNDWSLSLDVSNVGRHGLFGLVVGIELRAKAFEHFHAPQLPFLFLVEPLLLSLISSLRFIEWFTIFSHGLIAGAVFVDQIQT